MKDYQGFLRNMKVKHPAKILRNQEKSYCRAVIDGHMMPTNVVIDRKELLGYINGYLTA